MRDGVVECVVDLTDFRPRLLIIQVEIVGGNEVAVLRLVGVPQTHPGTSRPANGNQQVR